MASPANEQPHRAALWEDDLLEARDTTRRHHEWTPRDFASSREARDHLYEHAGPLRVRAQPLSEETFLEMQRNLMQHILVLEVLIGVLLFAIVVVGGILGLQWRSKSRSSSGRRGGFQPLPPYHSRQSSDTIAPLQMPILASYSLTTHTGPSSAQHTGKSTLNAAGLHTIPVAKTLPKTPSSAGSVIEQQTSYSFPKPASVASTSSSSTTRAPSDPFASPARSPRSLPAQPMTATTLPVYPTSQLAHDREEDIVPTPVKRAPDAASFLGEELGPVASSSTGRSPYANPNGIVLPGKKSARQMSIPRSDFDGSFGTAPTVSGTNASGIYPTVSDYLSRLRSTSNRDLTHYTSNLTAQGWTTLDSLRGVTSAELRDAVRGMSSAEAGFLAKSIQQELDWIDAQSVRGGLGFRMVLNS